MGRQQLRTVCNRFFKHLQHESLSDDLINRDCEIRADVDAFPAADASIRVNRLKRLIAARIEMLG
jgi:hypothetical protein